MQLNTFFYVDSFTATNFFASSGNLLCLSGRVSRSVLVGSLIEDLGKVFQPSQTRECSFSCRWCYVTDTVRSKSLDQLKYSSDSPMNWNFVQNISFLHWHDGYRSQWQRGEQSFQTRNMGKVGTRAPVPPASYVYDHARPSSCNVRKQMYCTSVVWRKH